MTPLKIFHGTQIYVTDTGKFSAAVNGKTVTKPSLTRLEKLLTPTGSVQAVCANSGYDNLAYLVNIVGVKQSTSRSRWTRHQTFFIRDNGQKIYPQNIYLPNAENEAQLEAITARYTEANRIHLALREELMAERASIISTLEPLTIEKFAELTAARKEQADVTE